MMKKNDSYITQRVYIGVGGNLQDSLAHIHSACRILANSDNITVVARSALYKSAPVGPPGQNDYLNAALAIDTTLNPEQLLAQLQSIELKHGRVRPQEVRWGSRTLDLDILLFGDIILQESHLTIPHAQMKNRYFVLFPLAQIAPDLILPTGQTLQTLLQDCPKTKLEQL